MKNFLQSLARKFVHILFINKHLHLLILKSIYQSASSSLIKSLPFSITTLPQSRIYEIPFSTQDFSFNFSYFLAKMSDVTVHLMSGSKCDISPIVGMRVSPDSRLPPIAHDHMGPEVISLSDYSFE